MCSLTSSKRCEALAASIETDGVPPLEVASASMEGSCLTIIARQPDGTEIAFRLLPAESGLAGRWAVAGGTSGEIVARKER